MNLMKQNKNRKSIETFLLVMSCAGILLTGCAADRKNANEQTAGQTISKEDVEEVQTQDAAPSPDLYEQFLNNSIPAIVRSDYPVKNYYAEEVFQTGDTYTLSELGTRVCEYFLHPEFSDKTSYDEIQYAWIECPDSPDSDKKNLLLKFTGLDIYAPNDDSYAVFVLTEENGQLYFTDEYQCWARSGVTAYSNGTLKDYGSAGAGDHLTGLSVILSDGKQMPVYSIETLSGSWTGYVSGTIYNEIFYDVEAQNFTVSICTIGDKQYYQYDLSGCSEEEKAQCESYVQRCRDEQGVHWAEDEEIQAAINDQCGLLGIPEDIAQQQEETVWYTAYSRISLP